MINFENLPHLYTLNVINNKIIECNILKYFIFY